MGFFQIFFFSCCFFFYNNLGDDSNFWVENYRIIVGFINSGRPSEGQSGWEGRGKREKKRRRF